MSLIDTSSLQYMPWRAVLIAITPNPQIEQHPYRPANWYKANMSNTTIVYDDKDVAWYFDAIIKLEHGESQRVTEHPVQTGANISDHSYALPAMLTLEIGMSEVMDSVVFNQWGVSSESFSVRSFNAYQKLLEWKSAGLPLAIDTRLNHYENMVIQTLTSPDDIKTLWGLKCLVTFRQIFTASIKITQKQSTRSSVTDTTKKAQQPATQVNNTTLTNLVPGLKAFIPKLGF